MSAPRRDERVGLLSDLARQMSLLIGAYRLFPDDPTQPAFAAAVQRVQAAAEVALAGGAVDIEILHGVIRLRGQPFPEDGTLVRLAGACYDRQIEHVRVTAVPSTQDLAAFGEALSEPVEDSLAHGGPERIMRERGVTSIVLWEVRPASDDEAHEGPGLGPELRELWEALQDPGRFAANMTVQVSGRATADAAHEILDRLRSLYHVMPEDLVGRGGFFRRVRAVLDELPAPVRHEVLARVVTRAASDQFATSFLVDMTDTQLAAALIDLSRDGGPDPYDLMDRVAAATDRSPDVRQLIASALGEDTPAAEPAGGTARADADARLREVFDDGASSDLFDAGHRDATAIREEWPADARARRMLAEQALRDYLRHETRLDVVDAVLERWIDAARETLRHLDPAALSRLTQSLDPAVVADPDGPVAQRIAGARSRVATAQLLADLVEGPMEQRQSGVVQEMLGHLPGRGLDAVLDQLAVEDRRGARAQLVSLAVALSAGEVARVLARLDDDRWFVVRNLVTILGRLGDPDAVPALHRLAGHHSPEVRRETLRALAMVAGSDAVPQLRRLVDDEDPSVRAAALAALTGSTSSVAARALADVARAGTHTDERGKAIAGLADHPAPEVPRLLEELASRGGTRLPRQLRKQARDALRTRRGA